MVTKEERGGGRDKLGVCDEHIQTTIYKIDNPQGLYITGNYIQYLQLYVCMYVCMYITESLGCTLETKTAL